MRFFVAQKVSGEDKDWLKVESQKVREKIREIADTVIDFNKDNFYNKLMEIK